MLSRLFIKDAYLVAISVVGCLGKCPIKFIVTLMIIVGWLLVFNAKIESNHTYLYEEYFIIFPEPNLHI